MLLLWADPGHLYVDMSRVKRKEGLKILIHDAKNLQLSTTMNVVYKEVFENLLCKSYQFILCSDQLLIHIM